MKTTDLTTSDNDINVILGGCPLPPNRIRKEAYGSLKYLYTDLTDIRKYYIRLGFHLEEFYRCEYFRDFGYLCLEDFCDKNLGLDKSAVSRCINVYREFNAKDDQKSNCGFISKGCPMELSEKWQDYSYTQLCEMLPLSPEQRKKISPDMTIRQIRDYKRSLKNKPVASTQQEDSERETVELTQQKQPKIFNYEEYVRKNSGIIEQNYIKSCDPVDSVAVDIFDNRGRKILCNYWGVILEKPTVKNNNRLVIRMSSAFDPAVIIVSQQPDQEGGCNE